MNESGEIARAKASLVARSFGQRAGIDFLGTFSPCSEVTGIRLWAALTCGLDLGLCHSDAEQAFVQPKLKEVVFFRVPSGCHFLSGEVARLRRNLDGLR